MLRTRIKPAFLYQVYKIYLNTVQVLLQTRVQLQQGGPLRGLIE